jgi:hypothetical protein
MNCTGSTRTNYFLSGIGLQTNRAITSNMLHRFVSTIRFGVMDIPTPMCRACGVDRELVEVDHPHASFDVPHFRCPTCRDVRRLAVRHGDEPYHSDDRHP